MQDEEFEAIRKLMRLKRHESPGEGFTEDFLRQFHRLQSENASRETALNRFIRQMEERWEAFLNPKWGLAAAVAVIASLAVFLMGFPRVTGDSVAQDAKTAVEVEAAKKMAQDEKNELKNKPSGVAIPVTHEDSGNKALNP
jgi:hypothetical protein